MQEAPWTCQFAGCRSTPEQVAALRTRKPEGFPHDEDQTLRVCTVCRRLPLSDQLMGPASEDNLDNAFVAGIKEELASIEEDEKNIQALSQVFRYYAKYAKQLSQVLFDFTTKQCFPWEMIHAFYLIDDILLMDKTGRYKAEFVDRVKDMAVIAFKKVPDDKERREVAKMLYAWQELSIFDPAVLEGTRAAVRATSASAGPILDEAAAALAAEAEDEPEPPAARPWYPMANGPAAKEVPGDAPTAKFGAGKRPREDGELNGHGAADAQLQAEKKLKVVSATPINREAAQAKTLAVLERLLSVPLERPFEILGLTREGVQGMDIRKAYRRLALIIHPDKNPGLEAKCQEALVKLQQGREQAETDLQRMDLPRQDPTVLRSDTRSAATQANNAADTTFKCKHPGCDLPPCKQCANGCCTRNITHCHMVTRLKGGLQCFFHPPPRAWARNA